ncbi:MAG: hypothetical protein HYY84_02005 [Deltaproteobacteria bacterium]|nr:hypothetical protein [Deltaproteobacteria bacterium]
MFRQKRFVKWLKYVVVVCGAVGLVAVLFLPMIRVGPFMLRAIDDTSTVAVVRLLVGFAVPLVLAALAIFWKAFPRWAAIVSAIAFMAASFALVPEGGRSAASAKFEAIGYDLMLFSAFIGMVASVVASIFLDRKAPVEVPRGEVKAMEASIPG